MSNVRGKSIRLFMVDGTPQGILTLEIVNWTGHVLSGPRTKISELVQRPEMNKTGIYFLTGPDPEGSYRPVVYIGESDNVRSRLVTHNQDASKDFWERACIITSKDQNLTKAHARYLESRLIAISEETGHAKLFNGTAPKNEGLPEADIADMEYFITQIRMLLPVLGLDFLREKPQITKIKPVTKPEIVPPIVPDKSTIAILSKAAELATSPIFELQSRKDDIRALAQELEGEFIVFAGSLTRVERQSSGIPYQKLFDTLVAEGKIKIDDAQHKGVFLEDVYFTSPSAAADTILGRSSNGRREWKVQGTNKSYADWQNEQLSDAEIFITEGLEKLG